MSSPFPAPSYPLAMNEPDDPLAPVRERFVASLSGWREEISSLEANQDHDGLRAECHRVKGTAAMLQLPELSACAKACEGLVGDGSYGSSEWDVALSNLHEALDQLFDRPTSPSSEGAA